MKTLLEIAKIVENIRVKTTDILAVNGSKKSKVDIFFKKMISGEFKTDDQVADFFYQTGKNDSKYKNLKHQLRKRLISTLFFIDPKKANSDYSRAFLYCSKHMFAAKMLVFLNASSGIDLCHKIFNKAIEYDLTEFILDSSRHLRLHYGSKMGNREKFDYYNAIFKKYLKVWIAEKEAEEYYAALTLPNVQKKEANQAVHILAQEYYDLLQPHIEAYDSPFLHFLGNYINIIALMSQQNYIKTVEVCEKSLTFFDNKPYHYRTPVRVFLHHQLICYTQLKEYDKGQEVAMRSASFVKKGTYTWFINKELHLMLAMHSQRYEEAMIILNDALSTSKLQQLPSAIKEKWLIYEAYIQFLIYIGKISPEKVILKQFRIGKFLNSIPNFSKDKRGLNIPVLVIQILFMIVKKDYDQTIDRFDAIEKYCSRYLRKDDNFRSNCFIKMLLQIPNANFHRAGVERKAAKYFKQLQESPLEISKQVHEVEIIPYEDLWLFITESLQVKFHKSRRAAVNKGNRESFRTS